MDPVVGSALLGGAGGIVGFWIGSIGRKPRYGYRRKALIEVLGGTLVGSCVGFALSQHPLTFAIIWTWTFIAGLVWSSLSHFVRLWLTRRIRQSLGGLRNAWQTTGHDPKKASIPTVRLAVRWPASYWARIFDLLGLTDLSTGEVRAYEKYRSVFVWEALEEARRAWTIWRWLRTPRALTLVATSLAGVAVYLVTFGVLTEDQRNIYRHLIQAVVVCALLLQLPDPLVDDNGEPDETAAAWSFYRFWCSLLASWVLLYLLMYWHARIGPSKNAESYWEVSTHLMNNVNSWYSLMCFLVLYDPPFLKFDSPSLLVRHERVTMSTRYVAAGIVTLLAVAEIWCYATKRTDNIVWSEWAAGLVGAVAMAHLVGRLESDYINPPLVIIVVLYFYAVLQATRGALKLSADWESALLALAIVLKCLLVLFITWLLESGALSRYMRSTRIDRPAPRERELA